jgi:hypothetical protein
MNYLIKKRYQSLVAYNQAIKKTSPQGGAVYRNVRLQI